MDENNQNQDVNTSDNGDDTSEEDTPQYTQAQVDKMLNDDRAARGRTDADFKKREDAVKEGEGRLSAWEKQKREDDLAQELAQASDDPEKQKKIREKHERKWRLDDRERELNERDTKLKASEDQHKAEIETANEAKLEQLCFKLQSKYGVDPALLKEKVIKFKLKTEEDIEDLAKSMAKGKTGDDDGDGKKSKKPLDSGKTTGETGDKYKTVSFDPDAPSAAEMISTGIKKEKK